LGDGSDKGEGGVLECLPSLLLKESEGQKIVIVGISGGSGSGKTTFARLLQEALGGESCSLLQQDSYYHDCSDRFDYDGGSVNFDHPDSIDFAMLSRHLDELRAGRPVSIPVYDFASHRRLEATESLDARRVILVEGMLILSQGAVRERLDVTVFIDASEEVRLSRRLSRDALDRGRDPVGVKRQFTEHVKPMHDLFVEPSRSFADIVYSGEELMETNVRDFIGLIGGEI
jgi:uridine kinase